MTGGRLLLHALGSLAFPGFGHGLTHQRGQMLVWSLLAIAATLAITVSVWFLPLVLAIRLASAADSLRFLRRHTGPGNATLAAIAVVIAALGLGYAKLALEAFRIPSSSMYPTLEIDDHIYVDKLTVRWRGIERGEVIVFDHPCSHVPYVKRVIAIGGDTVEVRCNVVHVNGAPLASALVFEKDTYQDYDEHADRWYSRECSRYQETHGSRTYEVFHDRERPVRERARDTIAASDRHDFPDTSRPFAPSCRHGDFYPDAPGARQPTGTLVRTKANARPCELQQHFVVPAGALFVMGDNRNNANDSRYWGLIATDAVLGRVVGIWMSSGERGRFKRFGAVD